MKIDWKNLMQGVKNSIVIKDEIEKIAAERIAICNLCPYYSPNRKKAGYQTSRPDNYCVDCGCNMHLKTRALAAQCPLGTKDSNFPNEQAKWLAVVADPLEAEQLESTPEIKKELDDYKLRLMTNKIKED